MSDYEEELMDCQFEDYDDDDTLDLSLIHI